MIVLIYGLPGSGKTSLAKELVSRTNSIHLNADDVRSDLNSDLGFTMEDRVEQSRRMGALARLLDNQGYSVVVDFVCPTEKTREVFGHADYRIWMRRVESGRFEDTNAIFEESFDYNITFGSGLTVEEEVKIVIDDSGMFDWRKPTTLMLGRYQPWHEGHQALLEEGFNRTEQVVVGVRDTYNTSEKDPFTFNQVKDNIGDNKFVVKFPNITNIIYGRDVGYLIEKVELSSELQKISATQKRKELYQSLGLKEDK
jgi:cytidyltransferase-like protein